MSLEVGQLLDDKYVILRRIGKGGMGSVYEGEHEAVRRRVAIKVLNADVAGDPNIVMRFEREAQAGGRIGSDHIVEVFDLGKLPSGERYMVMEFLDGECLADRMKREVKMAPEAIFPICIGLLDGLADAHAAGILHRDLKPANVFLCSDREQADFVKILDFGVSKFMELSAEDATATGVTLGTPRYMSPEQAKGEKDVDFRADIYSVGVVLFRALTGRPPFKADTYNELMFKVVLEDPPSLSELVEDADPFIVRLVAKAMDRDRDKRFQSASEMADEIRGWLNKQGRAAPSRPSARRPRQASASGSVAWLDEGEGSTRISVPEFASEPTSTKHAATMVAPHKPNKRRWGLWLMAAVTVVVVAATTVRVIQVVTGETSVATPDVPGPVSSEPVAAPTTSASSSVGAPSAAETAEPEASTSPEPSASPSVIPSASAAPSSSTGVTPSLPSSAWSRPVSPPPRPPPPVKRKYRRKL